MRYFIIGILVAMYELYDERYLIEEQRWLHTPFVSYPIVVIAFIMNTLTWPYTVYLWYKGDD